jgi:hypothetical protein
MLSQNLWLRNQGALKDKSNRAQSEYSANPAPSLRCIITDRSTAMSDFQPRRLADGGIDYDYYRHRARRIRRVSRRRAGRHCARLFRPLAVAAVAAALVLVVAAPADCATCDPKLLNLASASRH